MSFSVAFWNVENFHGRRSRADRVEEHIRALDGRRGPPDLFALCEVKDKTLMRDLLWRNFSDYDFSMSDTATMPRGGRRRTQIEILVGWRPDAFDQVLYTQRIEVTGGRMSVRPGVLVNVRIGTRWYSVLFLHTKSGPNTEAYDARQKQFRQIFRLKRTLDELEPSGRGNSRYIAVGDLNTMGNGSRGQPRRVTGTGEVSKLARHARRYEMRIQVKEHANTFNQRGRHGRLTSNLDHVLTSSTIRLRQLGARNFEDEPFTVRVSGWNQFEGDQAELQEFEDTLSDHSALYFEVQT